MNGETTFINSKAPKSLYISSNVLPELLFVKCPLGKSFENIFVILLMAPLDMLSAFAVLIFYDVQPGTAADWKTDDENNY